MNSAKPTARAGFGLSLKGRALRLLAAREYSRAELERKLRPHEETPGQLAQILDELQAKDFISEARVVESVIHRRAGRFGAARIKYELLNKGLGAEAVAGAMDSLKSNELERAQGIWRRKFDGLLRRGAAAQISPGRNGQDACHPERWAPHHAPDLEPPVQQAAAGATAARG